MASFLRFWAVAAKRNSSRAPCGLSSRGLFRVIRPPICAAFALTLWIVPVWTPEQLAIAVTFTAFCVLAPRLKERRFAMRYGRYFDRYRAKVPYILQWLRRAEGDNAQ